MKDFRGFTLIEVLVASAIGVILILAMATFHLQQQKEMNRLRVKSELSDMSEILRTSFANSEICTANVADLVLDANKISDGSLSHSTEAVQETVDKKAPKLFKVGAPIRNIHPEVTVDKILFHNWSKISTDFFRFDVEVQVSSKVGAFAPLKISGVNAWTSPGDPETSKKVFNCAIGLGNPVAQTMADDQCRTVISKGSLESNADSVACDPDEKVQAGGGECVQMPSLEDWDKVAKMQLSSGKPSISRVKDNGWEIVCPGVAKKTAAAAYAICCKTP